MPPKESCQEHGERLAVVETQVGRLESDMRALQHVVSALEKVAGRLGLAWWIIAAVIGFGSSVAGNVAAAHFNAPTSVYGAR